MCKMKEIKGYMPYIKLTNKLILREYCAEEYLEKCVDIVGIRILLSIYLIINKNRNDEHIFDVKLFLCWCGYGKDRNRNRIDKVLYALNTLEKDGYVKLDNFFGYTKVSVNINQYNICVGSNGADYNSDMLADSNSFVQIYLYKFKNLTDYFLYSDKSKSYNPFRLTHLYIYLDLMIPKRQYFNMTDGISDDERREKKIQEVYRGSLREMYEDLHYNARIISDLLIKLENLELIHTQHGMHYCNDSGRWKTDKTLFTRYYRIGYNKESKKTYEIESGYEYIDKELISNMAYNREYTKKIKEGGETK